VDPRIGKLAFTLGIYFLLMALIALPFLSPSSAAFWADLMAIGVSGLFLAGLIWRIRREARIIRREPRDWQRNEQDD